MNRTVTLTLPAEVLDHANRVAEQSGRTLDSILAAWIQCGADSEEVAILTPGAQYPIYTPYGDTGAGEVLHRLLREVKVRQEKADQDQ
ncbi:MAG: hypothetical protein M3Z04_16855 [Chloroflexota bacterium]|nr:hypothetical protein [Chloroflexota bacterium]